MSLLGFLSLFCLVFSNLISKNDAFVITPSTKFSPFAQASLRWSSSSPLNRPLASNDDIDLPLIGDRAFPLDLPLTRVEGGKTVKTWKLPIESDRCQVFLKSGGRPMRATVSLWIGPIRTVHTMTIDTMNGELYPYRAVMKFKKDLGPTLQVVTSADDQLPVWVGVQVPSPIGSKKLDAFTNEIWDNRIKTRIQGAPITGGTDARGAVRVFNIDGMVDSVQVVLWSKDTSKKSLKAKIEILQGPNNYRQVYDLYCGSTTQPLMAVFNTPGPGWVIRIFNKKYIEDGLFECAVVPFQVDGQNVLDDPSSDNLIIYPDSGTRSGSIPIQDTSNKPWWLK